ncbi:MAG: hypothetical protein KJS68_16840, partial [Alphaproteobacteria bacterium]|nr:hypothetical protein [Alphaproteobacteria bacterium]
MGPYFKIADRGQKLLNDRPTKIDNGLLARFPEFVEWKSRTRSGKELVTEATDTVQSPDDQIATNVEHLNKDLSDELITRVHSF